MAWSNFEKIHLYMTRLPAVTTVTTFYGESIFGHTYKIIKRYLEMPII